MRNGWCGELLGEAAEGGGFVGEFGEDLVEFGDFQDFFDSGGKADDFHAAALFNYAHVIADQFADAGAVEILEAGEIEDQVFVTLGEEAKNGVAEGSGFKRGEAPGNFDERNLFRLTDGDLEAQLGISKGLESSQENQCSRNRWIW